MAKDFYLVFEASTVVATYDSTVTFLSVVELGYASKIFLAFKAYPEKWPPTCHMKAIQSDT